MEESRSRWGDRTSNPGGAVGRSQVGSTPILLRHLAESLDTPTVHNWRGARLLDAKPS